MLGVKQCVPETPGKVSRLLVCLGTIAMGGRPWWGNVNKSGAESKTGIRWKVLDPASSPCCGKCQPRGTSSTKPDKLNGHWRGRFEA
jgi:hypothetical protein